MLASIDSPVVGGDSYDLAIFEALGEKFGSEIYFVTHTWMGPESNPKMPEFIKLFNDYYGSDPDTAFVAVGWDTIMMLAEAVQIAGSTEGSAVARALEENEFDLLTGKLSYSSAAEGHYPAKAAALVAPTGGKPSFLGWRRPENPLPP